MLLMKESVLSLKEKKKCLKVSKIFYDEWFGYMITRL